MCERVNRSPQVNRWWSTGERIVDSLRKGSSCQGWLENKGHQSQWELVDSDTCERGCSPWLTGGMKHIFCLTLISWCFSMLEALICFIQQFDSRNISIVKGQGPDFSYSGPSKRWEIKLCRHATSIIYGLRKKQTSWKTSETSIVSPIRSQVRNV